VKHFRQHFLAAAAALLFAAGQPAAAAEVQSELWDGKLALGHIADLLRFTPRAMEAPGHQATIDYIKAALAKSSADMVVTQSFVANNDDGKPLHLTNIIARFQANNPRRVIVATHYDSIVRAYRDPKTPDAPMPGANNSSSGVALLLETARVLSLSAKPDVGIDMIFFDGEEGPKSLGAGDPTWHALGSPFFVQHIKDYYPARLPETAVDFDMVCDKDLKLQPEPSSIVSARPEVTRFWTIGNRIAPHAFVGKSTPYDIADDHTALQGAGIPSFLVIDFDYEPYFNTTQDTIDKCSVDSLQTVGRTLLQYLYAQ
jgi:glutaminyl-peptide cyclotransferase